MKVLVLGDTHLPFADRNALKKVVEFSKKFEPDVVVQVGDLYDNYSFSKYTININNMTPEQEMRRGRTQAEELWSSVGGKQRIQMMGNHCARIAKRVEEKLPALLATVKLNGRIQNLCHINSLFKFSGVETIDDYTAEKKIGDTLYIHGFNLTPGYHMRYYHSKVVCAHSHKGGVTYDHIHGKTLWELNAGFLGDRKQVAFKYGDSRVKNWTVGYGVVDDYGPRFIAL